MQESTVLQTHSIQIGSLQRTLPIVEVAPGVRIALFNSLGDCAICKEAAQILAPKLPEADFLLTAETKGIPFTHALAEELGLPYYGVARKTQKPYMNVEIQEEVRTISTQTLQMLYLDAVDASRIKNRRVLIVDDVISTGESLAALERIVERAEGILVGKVAILSEGEANQRSDIQVLGQLPLFS